MVDALKRESLTGGTFKNAGGTDINCVYRHLLSMPIRGRTPSRVVVLTDGYTGYPQRDLIKGWQERKVEMHVGLVGSSSNFCLQAWFKTIQRLPSFLLIHEEQRDE